MPLGYRVYSNVPRPSAELLETFSGFSSTDLCDAMNKSGTMNTTIRPGFPVVERVVGPAVTISVPTGSQQIRTLGIDLAQSGDVLVFNGLGATEYAMIGGNFARSLLSRGVSGIVIDGAFRDLDEVRQMGLPVFSKGIATMGGPKEGPGEVNVPISCGNVVVNPGDIIVADNDGVVVIPTAHAEEVIEKARKIVADAEASQDALARGEVLNAEVAREKALHDGCEIR